MLRAFHASKLAIYQRYLSPAEFEFLRENYGKRSSEWPPLMAEIRQHMEDGTPAEDPRILQLARRWLELFRSYAGDDPQTQAKIRGACETVPELTEGTFMDKSMQAYIRRAISQLRPA